MADKIQYRVRPVTRYMVHRYEETALSDGREGYSSRAYALGEFDNEELAFNLAALLTTTEPGAVMLDGFGGEPGSEDPARIVADWVR